MDFLTLDDAISHNPKLKDAIYASLTDTRIPDAIISPSEINHITTDGKFQYIYNGSEETETNFHTSFFNPADLGNMLPNVTITDDIDKYLAIPQPIIGQIINLSQNYANFLKFDTYKLPTGIRYNVYIANTYYTLYDYNGLINGRDFVPTLALYACNGSTPQHFLSDYDDTITSFPLRTDPDYLDKMKDFMEKVLTRKNEASKHYGNFKKVNMTAAKTVYLQVAQNFEPNDGLMIINANLNNTPHNKNQINYNQLIFIPVYENIDLVSLEEEATKLLIEEKLLEKLK